MEGQNPVPTLGTPFPDDTQLYPPQLPTFFTYPTNLLTFSSKKQLSQSRLASGTNFGASTGLLESPKTAVLRAQSKGAVGGSRRSPLTGTTPYLRRCRRVCPGVSVCGRAGLPEAGLPEERGQAGGAPTARDSYLDLETPPEKPDSTFT